MDGKRFDDLTKSFAGRQSRRGVLRTLGGGLAAGLAAVGLGSADAAPGGKGKGGGNRCGGPGQPCKWNKQCCEYSGLICIDGACGCEDNFCPVTGACMPDCPADRVFDPASCTCLCANGLDCGGVCADCPVGGVCSGMDCVCPGGTIECDGTCYPSEGLCGCGTCPTGTDCEYLPHGLFCCGPDDQPCVRPTPL